VETHSRKTRANVDIYIMIDNNQAVGLALIASEPRQFTIVNIIGAIDLDKLHKLEGQFWRAQARYRPAENAGSGRAKSSAGRDGSQPRWRLMSLST